MDRRQYPVLAATEARPRRPLSFVVVHYSDDYFHNILRSRSVLDPFNQLIVVDNRQNLFFDNLSQAINAGLEQARHELVAVVHEDVLLPEGWQARFEQSLADLEGSDPEWGLLGAAGWTAAGELVGHWSDPHQYADTLGDASFLEVRSIDEQLMILRRASGMRFDDLLPSIHHLGRSLASMLAERGLKTYVVNAPTIHKYADAAGRPIAGPEQSPKIQARELPSFTADWACCDEYLYHRWPEWRPDDHAEPEWGLESFPAEVRRRLERPIVLLSRGGSGSRLLASLARDLGVFIGSDVNDSGDAMEMVEAVYMTVLNKHLDRAAWQQERIVPRLRLAAARMLERAAPAETWGFKLPEAMLVLPEIAAAFPAARCLHLIRDPLTTCLRRTHMTARFDNTIGRVALREAYRHCGRELASSLDDSPALRMAYTTIHQLESVRRYAHSHLGGRVLELRFEELLASPEKVLAGAAGWLGPGVASSRLAAEIDPRRAARPGERYPPQVEERVARVLAPLRRELGYL